MPSSSTTTGGKGRVGDKSGDRNRLPIKHETASDGSEEAGNASPGEAAKASAHAEAIVVGDLPASTIAGKQWLQNSGRVILWPFRHGFGIPGAIRHARDVCRDPTLQDEAKIQLYFGFAVLVTMVGTMVGVLFIPTILDSLNEISGEKAEVKRFRLENYTSYGQVIPTSLFNANRLAEITIELNYIGSEPYVNWLPTDEARSENSATINLLRWEISKIHDSWLNQQHYFGYVEIVRGFADDHDRGEEHKSAGGHQERRLDLLQFGMTQLLSLSEVNSPSKSDELSIDPHTQKIVEAYFAFTGCRDKNPPNDDDEATSDDLSVLAIIESSCACPGPNAQSTGRSFTAESLEIRKRIGEAQKELSRLRKEFEPSDADSTDQGSDVFAVYYYAQQADVLRSLYNDIVEVAFKHSLRHGINAVQ